MDGRERGSGELETHPRDGFLRRGFGMYEDPEDITTLSEVFPSTQHTTNSTSTMTSTTTATMKTAFVHSTSNGGGVSSRLVDAPSPTAAANLKPDQVLIRVVVAGSNPKDWK